MSVFMLYYLMDSIALAFMHVALMIFIITAMSVKSQLHVHALLIIIIDEIHD